MTRSYTPSQIADGLLAGEFTRDSAFVPLAEVEKQTRERDEARAALRPFSEFYLWPDDAGEWTANDVRSDEDWDEERNDAKVDDVFIKRAHIRAARKALEAKP